MLIALMEKKTDKLFYISKCMAYTKHPFVWGTLYLNTPSKWWERLGTFMHEHLAMKGLNPIDGTDSIDGTDKLQYSVIYCTYMNYYRFKFSKS